MTVSNGERVPDDARINDALDDACGIVQGALPRDLFANEGRGEQLANDKIAPWLRKDIKTLVRLWAVYLLSDVTTSGEGLVESRRLAAQDHLTKVCHNADILRVLPDTGTG